MEWHKWVNEQNVAWHKWQHEQNAKAAERAHDREEEFARQTNDAAINGANLAIRMALLINGGAAVALLTFVGNLPAGQKQAIARTLDWFAWGVAAALAALALAYFTNYFIVGKIRSRIWTYEPPYVKDGPTTKRRNIVVLLFRCLAIFVGIGSLVLFIGGMLAVRAALTKMG